MYIDFYFCCLNSVEYLATSQEAEREKERERCINVSEMSLASIHLVFIQKFTDHVPLH